MAAVQSFSSSWRIHLLLLSIVLTRFSTPGLALIPVHNQQVRSSQFLENNKNVSSDVQRQGNLGILVSVTAPSKSLPGVEHQSHINDNISDLTLTFGTTDSIHTQNIRVKRDENDDLGTSAGPETPDSLLSVSNATVMENTSKPSTLLAETTQVQWSSELSVTETTLTPSPLTVAASPVLKAEPINVTETTTQTTEETHSTKITTPFSSTEPPGYPQSCNISIVEINDGEVQISWSSIPQDAKNSRNVCMEVISVQNDACKDYKRCFTETVTSEKVSSLCHFNNYTVWVSLEGDIGNWTNCTQDFKTRTAAPNEPTNLENGTVTNTTIALQWSPPTFPNGIITNYTVYWATSVLETWDTSQETNYTIRNLTPFTNYNISVTAWTLAGESKKRGGPLVIQTEQGTPTEPRNLENVNVTNTTIALKWSPPVSPNGKITYYMVYWMSSDSKSSDTSQGTSYTMKNLTSYTNYTVSVSAWTSVGESLKRAGPLRIETQQGIPDPPEDVVFSEVSEKTLTFKWSPPSVIKGDITNYSVYWRELDSAENWQTAVTDNTTMQLVNLRPFTNYTVKISAWTIVGEGPTSEEKIQQTEEGIPDPPRELTVKEVSNTTLTLEWLPPSASKGDITKYSVYWKKSYSEGDFDSEATDNTTLELKSLSPYTNYTVKASAWTIAGEGPTSEERTKETLQGIPDPPEDVVFSEVSEKTLTLKWSPPSVIKGDVTNYSVYWRELDTAENWQKAVTDDTTMQIKSLRPFTNYTVKISAWTIVGEGSASEENIQQTKEGIPGPPLNLNVQDGTNISLSLSWSPPIDPNGEILKYDVSWSFLLDDGRVEKKTGTANETFFNISGLTPYVNYTLSVAAWTSAGRGTSSVEKHYATDVGVPSKPENVSVSYTASNVLILSWQEPKYSRGPIDGYFISWKKTEEAKSAISKDTKNGNILTYEIKGLTPFTNYTLWVTPYNTNRKKEVLKSETSGIIQAQTAEGIPSPPRSLRVEAFTNTTFNVTWQVPETPNGGMLVYTVYWQLADGKEERNHNTTTNTRYVISNLSPFTKYNLTVSAATIAGEGPAATGKLKKTDVGVPSSPQNGTASYVNDTSILVEWRKPEFPHGPLNGFTVRWRKGFSDGESNATVSETWHECQPVEIGESCNDFNALVTDTTDDDLNATEPVCQYHVTDLDPWTNYSIEIKAYNENQHQECLTSPPEMIQQATKAAVPEEPILNSVQVVNSTAVSVSWSYTGRFPGPLSYAIYLETNVEDDCTAHDQRNITRGLRNGTADVTGLRPFTSYKFRVFARTPAGSSRSRNTIDGTTRPDVPERPTNIKVNCGYSPTKASVSWRTPNRENGLIEQYKIRYKPKKDGQYYEEVIIKVAEPKSCVKRYHQAELQNLHPETAYEISVMGKTRDVSRYGGSASNNEQCILSAGVPPFPNDTLPDIKETNQQEAKFGFSEATFSSKMGEIRYYAIIVAFSHVIGEPTNGSTDEAMNQKLPVWNQFWKQTSEIYQATPENWNPFQENNYDPLQCKRNPDSEDFLYCTIGWEKNCSEEEPTYCNGPLIPGKRYGIKLRGFTAGGFSETSPIYISTAPIVTGSPTGTIVGLLLLFLLVILLAVAVFLDKRNNYKTLNRIRNFFRKKDLSVSGQNVDIVLNDTSTSNSAAKTQTMDFPTFLNHVKIMMSDSFLRFSLEYEEIKQNSPKPPCTAAEMEENRAKNRWMNIFPFDHSRVKLLPIDDEPSSDYINANYIPGFTSHREYIATQGPLPNTVDDFWRMVWEQGVTMIVMLTQCVERGKKKCEQYWPSDSDNVHYGDLKIQLKSESILSAYCIRIFDLQLGTRQHTVKQMHFTKWPDFGSPESPEDLINFVQAVRDHLPHTNTGPILVHCSAGVGRTGTFIAVDRLLQHIQYYTKINIYNIVVEMRQYRTNMVQTEDQYVYIHKCMRDIISPRLNPRASIYDDDDDDNLYTNINVQATEL